jgi:hypothetical protein
MLFSTNDFDRPARKAMRASKSAKRVADDTVKAIAGEARTFGRRSAKHLAVGAARGSKRAVAIREAGDDAADIARMRLQRALEALQASSDEMSRWAGSKAGEVRDQAKEMARDRPISLGAALLAVGALLGVAAGLALRD